MTSAEVIRALIPIVTTTLDKRFILIVRDSRRSLNIVNLPRSVGIWCLDSLASGPVFQIEGVRDLFMSFFAPTFCRQILLIALCVDFI